MEFDRPGSTLLPMPSTGTSSARTWCGSSPGSIPCRPMSASSCSVGTVPAPTRRRSRKACRSSSGSFATGPSAAARRNSSSPGPERPGLGQDHRHHLGPARRQDRLLRRDVCPACSSRTSASTTKLVRDNERMLTGGFYAEVDLTYDAVIAQEKNGRPFSVAGSAADPALETRRAGRSLRGTEEVHYGGVERLPAPQHRPGADRN